MTNLILKSEVHNSQWVPGDGWVYETPTKKITGLTRAEAAIEVWENHRDCFLKNGCDVYIMEDALDVLRVNRNLAICEDSNPLIKGEVARVYRQR